MLLDDFSSFNITQAEQISGLGVSAFGLPSHGNNRSCAFHLVASSWQLTMMGQGVCLLMAIFAPL